MKLSLDEWMNLTTRLYAQEDRIRSLRAEIQQRNQAVAEAEVRMRQLERVVNAAVAEGYNPATGKFDARFTREENDDTA